MIGFSTIIYALSGMCVLRSADWRPLALCNLALIALQSFFAGFAVMPHLYCFCAGCAVGFIFNPRYERK